MTKIKLCGISRLEDIQIINELNPEYIGFVFAKKSKRFILPEVAASLASHLSPAIHTVGVFVNESVKQVAHLLNANIIDIAQLHGNEDEQYIKKLRELSSKPIIKAFCVEAEKDIVHIESCSADYVLLDSGAGSGQCFEWSKIKDIKRPYFLAGGLDSNNVEQAIKDIHPYGVDVSSGIETNGLKDKAKMTAFVAAVRKETIL